MQGEDEWRVACAGETAPGERGGSLSVPPVDIPLRLRSVVVVVVVLVKVVEIVGGCGGSGYGCVVADRVEEWLVVLLVVVVDGVVDGRGCCWCW